jgi:NAD-dependent SIR2 family protein deacetylase
MDALPGLGRFSNFCWPELYVDGPELIIVTQAIDRLRRSTGGAVTNEEAQENLRQQPVCPKCGNEMFLHYGIDEPDFWLCDRVACRHKRYVGEQSASDECERQSKYTVDGLTNVRIATSPAILSW